MLKSKIGIFFLAVFSTITLMLLINVYFQYEEETKLQYLIKEKELLEIATQLSSHFDSFEKILKENDAQNLDSDRQAVILNRALQPGVMSLAEKYPGVALGFYSRDLNRNVAVGPHFSPAFLRRTIPDNLDLYQTGIYSAQHIEHSFLWDNKPIFTVRYPLFYNGKMIGHTFANTTIETMNNLILKGTIRKVIYPFCMWLLTVVLMFCSFYHLYKGRKQLQISIAHNLELSSIKEYPELLPILQTVKNLRKELETLIHHNPVGIVRYDRDCRLLFSNPEFCKRLWREELPLGRRYSEIGISEIFCQYVENTVRRVIETGNTICDEYNDACYFPERKSVRYNKVDWIPEKNEQGEVETVLAVSQDVTELKELHLIIQKQKEHLESIINNVSDSFYAVDKNMKFTYCNRGAWDYFGYNPVGKGIAEVYGNCNAFHIFKSIVTAKKTGKPIYFESKSAFRDRWVSVCVYPAQDGGFSVFFRDINERKLAEEQIRQANERFEKIFNLNPNIMVLTSIHDKVIVDANEAFVKASGITKEEIIGIPLIEFNSLRSKSQLDELNRIFEQQGSISNYEIEFYIGDKLRFGLLSSEIIELNGQKYILNIVADITEKKQFEEELAKYDRLNFIGQIASSVGHEVRNPMTTVRGYLQMFQRKPLFSVYRTQLDTMIEELDRANSIITEFLSLAKNKRTDLISSSLNLIIEALFPLIQADALELGHEIKCELKTIANLMLDKKEIRQVILNLTRNALEAMEKPGAVFIKTYTDKNEVVLEVSDNGKGISQEILHNLGTPFFTTKETGTGLGLAVCYRVAQRHNAKVEVNSSECGTTFCVKFPIEQIN